MLCYLSDSSPSASDDLQNPDKIRFVLKDLREARQAKCRDGLQKLDHSELSVRQDIARKTEPCSLDAINILSCQTSAQWRSTRYDLSSSTL
jgi:hypothetical protein